MDFASSRAQAQVAELTLVRLPATLGAKSQRDVAEDEHLVVVYWDLATHRRTDVHKPPENYSADLENTGAILIQDLLLLEVCVCEIPCAMDVL